MAKTRLSRRAHALKRRILEYYGRPLDPVQDLRLDSALRVQDLAEALQDRQLTGQEPTKLELELRRFAARELRSLNLKPLTPFQEAMRDQAQEREERANRPN